MAVLASVLVLLLACFTQEAAASDVTAVAAPSACIPADKCCKICDAGQACGNSCVSRSKQCHKGRGCSCNATEVCP